MCDNQDGDEPKRNRQVSAIYSVHNVGFRPCEEYARSQQSNTKPRMSKARREARKILREISKEEEIEHAKEEPIWESWETEEEYNQKVEAWKKKGANIFRVMHDEDDVSDQGSDTEEHWTTVGKGRPRRKHYYERGWIKRGRSNITQC